MRAIETQRRPAARVVFAMIVLGTLACGLGLLARRPGLLENRPTPAEVAYDRGDWVGTARLAHEALEANGHDPAALRLLARSSVRLGHDDTAIGIYTRRLAENAIEPEDFVLWGVAQNRRGLGEHALVNWNRALEAGAISAKSLDELCQLFYEQGSQLSNAEYVRLHPFDQATRAAELLRQRKGWELQGEMFIGLIRNASNDLAGAAESYRRVLRQDPNIADGVQEPTAMRKMLARMFLRLGSPGEARPHVQAISGWQSDPQAWWLLSRVALQEGVMTEARDASSHAEAYRRDHSLEEEPSPYVGEARCAKCHDAIAQRSLASRHTRTYHRGEQLRSLRRPDRPLADPTDSRVTHVLREVEGSVTEETRVGNKVLISVLEYAFGTTDRYLTMVTRDRDGRSRTMRLSYYDTAEGQGWDRTILDVNVPTVADDFQGQAISVRAGVVRCLYCHTTFPRAGAERVGPETADRAIGCERCHGPGRNHVLAIEAGLSDRAIVNPSSASPLDITLKQCNDCHILDPGYVNGDREDPAWVRSQGAGWAWSRCNTENGGRFGCVTCHDPHDGARATSTAEYEAKCLNCHARTKPSRAFEVPPAKDTLPTASSAAVVCPIDSSKGCLGCHMPSVRMESSHMTLTDHYIRARRPL
jgi:tetratricopeptide (TPR) repeat protein